MFPDFDPCLFSNPEFKEDSVREVIISPILTRLGYSPSGEFKIVRSKTLVHPFIYAGTRKLAVKLIPDYTLIHKDKPLVVIDAKAPCVDIMSRECVQQVYSYAIHPEIKSDHFVLCNGSRIVVFQVDSNDPLLDISFDSYESEWNRIERILSPKFLILPILRNFAPDLGMALHRMGFQDGGTITFLPAKLNLFSRIDSNLITASANVEFAEEDHCVSFDFSQEQFTEIISGLPKPLLEQFESAMSRQPFLAAAELAIEIDVETKLGPETEGQSESFRPLIIEQVISSRFDPLPLSEEATDIPDHVFRLRKAFKVRTSPNCPD